MNEHTRTLLAYLAAAPMCINPLKKNQFNPFGQLFENPYVPRVAEYLSKAPKRKPTMPAWGTFGT